MLGKTHVLIAAVSALALTGHFDPPLMAGAALGALAPDIDKSGSLITQLPVVRWFTRPASALAERTLRHRTGTHGLFVLLGLSLGVLCLREVFTPAAGAGFLIGYLTHLLADALTISGVPLLWPWQVRAYGLPKPLRLRTGGRVEYVLTLALLLAGVWCARR